MFFSVSLKSNHIHILMTEFKKKTINDNVMFQVTGVSCGYGFSVFTCKSKSDNTHLLYGTGINTDSQLGYQEFPKNSGVLGHR